MLLVPSLLYFKELWQTVFGLWGTVHTLPLVITVNVSCSCFPAWQEILRHIWEWLGTQPIYACQPHWQADTGADLFGIIWPSFWAHKNRGQSGSVNRTVTLTIATPLRFVARTECPSTTPSFDQHLNSVTI